MIAAPAEPLRDLFSPAGHDRHGRPNPVSVGPGALKVERDVVSARMLGAIVKVDGRLVVRDHDGVHSTVLIEIAQGKPSTCVTLLERTTHTGSAGRGAVARGPADEWTVVANAGGDPCQRPTDADTEVPAGDTLYAY